MTAAGALVLRWAYFGINADYSRIPESAFRGQVIEQQLRIAPATRPARPIWINYIRRLHKRVCFQGKWQNQYNLSR